ncbi:unnamed protein product [Closterium sp. Naga37s-1]|nr:unnamed protein product [Closterium sp. Naga37s-1]
MVRCMPRPLPYSPPLTLSSPSPPPLPPNTPLSLPFPSPPPPFSLPPPRFPLSSPSPPFSAHHMHLNQGVNTLFPLPSGGREYSLPPSLWRA